MLELRHYQRAALDSTYDYWADNGGDPLIVVPTGGGKSLIIASLKAELLAKYPTMRIASVTHVKELIEQNFLELIKFWPQAPAGIYSAGVGRRDARSKILFCGIQSTYKRAREIGRVDLLLVDEAHLIPPDATAMYGRFIRELREINPDMRIVGLTATHYRLQGGRNVFLTSGEDALFSKVVYEVPLTLLIDEGYLVPPVCKATEEKLDVSGVHLRGGEFIAGELAAAVDRADVTERAIAEVAAKGADRKSWLLFCASVEHCEHVAAAVRRQGKTCEVVTGTTPKGDRARIINAFKSGQVDALANMNVLTTGFNAPNVDLIAMLRPTKSTVLYVQMIGRGLRTAPGKINCLVLDFAGNVSRHGPVDMVRVQEHEDRAPGEAVVKECPECGSLIFAGLRECPDCGHEFPPPEIKDKIAPKAANLPLLSREVVPPDWYAVTQKLTAERHTKFDAPDSLRIDYFCGLKNFKQWVCLEHTGFAQQKAYALWTNLGGEYPIPKTVTEGLSRIGELDTPSHIQVRPNGKFFDIVGVKFEREKEDAA